MANTEIIRRTQFEHIVKFPLLSKIMKEVTSIEKFYGEHLSEDRILTDLEERLKEVPTMTLDNYIDIAAMAIVAAKLDERKS